jgi:hypothetical protein
MGAFTDAELAYLQPGTRDNPGWPGWPPSAPTAGRTSVSSHRPAALPQSTFLQETEQEAG